jgi:lipoprotein-anchoring transpeptidase ErfK/SrfK
MKRNYALYKLIIVIITGKEVLLMPGLHIQIHTGKRILQVYDGQKLLQSYPIAVGKKTTPTPHGRYTIANKHVNPGGVFGSHWLGLSISHYGIHGTNNPSSIGQYISKGCIRLQNHDVAKLYSLVSVGTPVTIQP